MKSLSLIVSFLFVITIVFTVKSQPGSLDNSFGNGGIVIAPDNLSKDLGYKVAIQPDQKIVLAGFSETNNIQDFAVARYNPDGSLDNSFGTGGQVIFDGGSDMDMAESVVLQDDGKILIGGSVFNQFTTVDDYAIVRFNTDGTPDNTFGSGGLVVTDFFDKWDNGYALTIQEDGKILLAGEAYQNDKRNLGIVRYNTDGSIDLSFGTNGFVIKSISSDTDRPRDMALQADGKILVAGWTNDGLDDQTFVARFNTDGSIDNTFANNGVATIDLGGKQDRFYALSILTDGKILCGGHSGAPSADYLLVKYLTDGTLDNTFGSNGMALSTFTDNDQINDITIQADGKILTAGGAFHFELVRFLETGYPDTGFGDNGIVNTSVGTGSAWSMSICLQADAKIIIGGMAKNGGEFNFALARYHAEESGYITDQKEIFHDVSIFPNPGSAGNSITLEYTLKENEELSIELLSINGKLLEVLSEKQNSKAGPHKESYKLPGNLSAGIYFVRLTSSPGSTVVRLEVL